MSNDLKGQTVANRYEIKGQLGVGGFGEVWQAHDPNLDRPVAIKILLPRYNWSPKDVDNFIKEAKTIAKLEHPHILRAHDLQNDVQDTESQVCLVLQFAKGGSLADYLRQSDNLPFDEAWQIFKQICQAVDYAHRNKVLHLDLKPDNILFDEDGNVLVADFGISKVLEATTHIKASTRAGTLDYMPPEQFWGRDVRPASDVYSLGLTFYEMLIGNLPRKSRDEDTHFVHIDEFLSTDLKWAIEKSTEFKQEDRYPSVKEFADAIEALSLPPLPIPVGRKLRNGPMIASMVFSPDGQHLAIGLYPCRQRDYDLIEGSDKVWLLDAATGRPAKKFLGEAGERLDGWGIHRLSISPNGKFLAALQRYDNHSDRGYETFKLYNWEMAGQQLQSVIDLPGFTPIVFSSNSKFLAWFDQKEVVLWDVTKKEKTLTFKCEYVNDIAFSPDGNFLATVGEQLAFWQVDTGKKVVDWPIGAKFVTYSPTGKFLAVVTDLSEVILFDATAPLDKHLIRKWRNKFEGDKYFTENITFSPDERFLALGGNFDFGGGVKIWHLDSGKSWKWWQEEDDFPYGHTAFSLDGKFLITAVEGEIWQFPMPRDNDSTSPPAKRSDAIEEYLASL